MQPHMNCRDAKVIQVVQVVTLEGEGLDGDPARLVTNYFDLDGKWLAVNDPFAIEPAIRDAFDKAAEEGDS